MAVRTVLSRMTRKGWLTAERLGTRSWYGLTPRGRKLLESGRERIYRPTSDASWDGKWSVIVFSVPEARRRLRDALRVRLSWLGCGLLTSGAWISPHDVRAEVLDIAADSLGKTSRSSAGSTWPIPAPSASWRNAGTWPAWTVVMPPSSRAGAGNSSTAPSAE
jgi:DNA-binding transcriptional regulator PaaX